MKKLGIVLVLVFLLCGCGKNYKNVKSLKCTVHRSNVEDGYEVDATYEATAENGYAKTLKTKEVVTSTNAEKLDEFEENFHTTYDHMIEAYGGYTYNVTREENKVIADLTLDYSQTNLNKMVEDLPALEDYIEDGKMTISGLKKMYESTDGTCETK